MSTTYTLQRGSSMEIIQRVHLRAPTAAASPKRGFYAQARSFLSNTEQRLERTLTKRARKQLLSTAGPLFLCMTFVEDGIRMPLTWSDQMNFMVSTRNFHSAFAACVLVASMVTQLVGSFVVLRAGRHVKAGAYTLLTFTALQPFLYGMHLDLDFMSRALTIAGGLLFLVWSEQKKAGCKLDMFSMGSLSDERSGDRLQLAGRLLLTILFLFQAFQSVSAAPSVLNVLSLLVLSSLSLMTCVGFKTEWSSLALTAILGVSAVWMYPFWRVDSLNVDYMRYHFFLTLSMMGGMMLLTLHGPGGLSLDGSKKAI